MYDATRVLTYVGYSNTKRETDSGRKSGYYTAILSRGLWSVSTAKQFASSLRQRGLQVSLFA